MFCAEWSLVKHRGQEVTVIPLRCKCWHCDECRPIRARGLVADAVAGHPTIFITLTSRKREDRTPSQAARELVTAWRKVRREYVKEHGKGTLAFLAVFEATKRGWPHLHIVARCKWLSQKWLSRRMADLHDSPVVDVRRVTGMSKIARYVSKYIGKNPHRFQGVKRYWRSLDYLEASGGLDEDDPSTWAYWEIEKWPFWMVVKGLLEDGYSGHVDSGHAVLRPPEPP